VVPFDLVGRDMRDEELGECVTGDLRTLTQLAIVLVEDVAVLIRNLLLLAAFSSALEKFIKQVALLDRGDTGFIMEVEHAGWFSKFFIGRLLAKFEDCEWDATPVKKKTYG